MKSKRNLLVVEIPDSIKDKLAIRTKKDGLKVSDIVRLALRKYLGITQ